MISLLLVLVACLGVVNATFELAGRDTSMKLQNAYPSFPSNPLYVSYKQFSDTSCTQLYQVISFLENTCLAGSGQSVMFSCVNGEINKAVYHDLICSGTPTTVPYTNSTTGCTVHGNSSLQTIACGTGAFDFGVGDYTVNVFNQDNSCAQPVVGTGMVNDYCYGINDDPYNSVLFSYPYLNGYTSTDCTGPVVPKLIGGDSCNFTTGADDDDDDDDDDFAKDNAYQSIIHYVDGVPPPGADDDSQDKPNSLSDGAIAGIVIGSLAGVILLVLGAMWLLQLGCFAVKAPMSAQQEMHKV